MIVITTKAGSGKQQASGATVFAGVGSDALRDLRERPVAARPTATRWTPMCRSARATASA